MQVELTGVEEFLRLVYSTDTIEFVDHEQFRHRGRVKLIKQVSGTRLAFEIYYRPERDTSGYNRLATILLFPTKTLGEHHV